MHIRPETVADYASIAAIHVKAFGNRVSEALMVALHRHRSAFDPGLSLVAEADGVIVGHVLFSPQMVRLLGQSIRAVNLAPIAIDPSWQGQGIGSRLIEEGHATASAKGYALSFLLGHTSYYPRFGYRTHAFGNSSVTVSPRHLPHDDLETHGPTEADLPMLHDLWSYEEGNVDMSIDPGTDLLDWLSPNPAIEALVWTRGNEVVGYTRARTVELARPMMFLARNHVAARSIASALAQRHNDSATEIVLPLHPASASAGAFAQPTATAWDAAMVCPLQPSPFDTYYEEVQAGSRAPGRPIWPVAFDLE